MLKLEEICQMCSGFEHKSEQADERLHECREQGIAGLRSIAPSGSTRMPTIFSRLAVAFLRQQAAQA
jgi:hypothetical protein